MKTLGLPSCKNIVDPAMADNGKLYVGFDQPYVEAMKSLCIPKYNLSLKSYIRFGASPRASIYLTRAARSHALMNGRAYVKPDDVKSIMMEVLRHRIIPTYEAEADEVDSDELVRRIKEGVAVP